jgi:hypothetical protein
VARKCEVALAPAPLSLSQDRPREEDARRHDPFSGTASRSRGPPTAPRPSNRAGQPGGPRTVEHVHAAPLHRQAAALQRVPQPLHQQPPRDLAGLAADLRDALGLPNVGPYPAVDGLQLRARVARRAAAAGEATKREPSPMPPTLPAPELADPGLACASPCGRSPHCRAEPYCPASLPHPTPGPAAPR